MNTDIASGHGCVGRSGTTETTVRFVLLRSMSTMVISNVTDTSKGMRPPVQGACAAGGNFGSSVSILALQDRQVLFSPAKLWKPWFDFSSTIHCGQRQRA